MPAYIAIYRGINVSGQKIIKMERLRAMFEGLGFDAVQTYIQSGNVIFSAKSATTASLATKIERKTVSEFGFEAAVLVRTPAEFQKIIQKNPLLKSGSIDLARLYVTFLSEKVVQSDLKKVDPYIGQGEIVRCVDQAVYLYCPKGYGPSKLSNNLFERVLGVTATTRNWRTVNQLFEMALL